MNISTLRQLVPVPSATVNYSALEKLFPIEPLKTTIQDSIYHAEGDVWTHTKMVLEELIKSETYQLANNDDRFVLFYAALLHDIAKPQCTRVENDRVTSKGHSRVGAIEARLMLWEMNVPFNLREDICSIISVHQLPFYTIRDADAKRSIIKLSHTVRSIKLLSAVASADMLGRMYYDQANSMVDIELFNIMAQELGVWEKPFEFPTPFTKQAYFCGTGEIDPSYKFWRPDGSIVTVMSGLPASGKDTYCKTMFGTVPIISIDDCVAEMGLRPGGDIGGAVHLATDRAKVLLAAKKEFVWNSTNLSRQMRQKTIDLMLRYDATVRLVYLEEDRATILKRNNERDSTLSNDKLLAMARKWEVPASWEAAAVTYKIGDRYERR